MTRMSAIVAALVAVVGLAVGGYFALRPGDADPFVDCRRGTVAGGTATIGGPFSLIDGDGRRMTDADVIKGPTLVYFGYTFCPDICPTDVSRNALAAADLAERGIDVGQVFISIDPERDTPEAVKAFSASMDPALVGLTGTADEISTAARAYKVYYRKAGDDPEYYLMDHSTFTYLMAPEVGFLEFFPSDTPPEEMAETAACYAEKLS